MSVFLVTGGSGFIGTHLCLTLLAKGHELIILDRKLSALSHPKLRMVQGSVTDADLVAALLASVNGCFHLAAIASVVESQEKWVTSHEINQTAVIIILEALRDLKRQGKVCPLVMASSAAVYGDNTHLPLQETTKVNPLSAYAIDKYASELHAHIGATLYQLSSASLRFFNVYGEGQDPNSPYSGVISIMQERFSSQEPFTLFGDGTQTRDFIHVSDVVNACILAMQYITEHEGHYVLNVCTGKEQSLLDLIDIFTKIYGKKTQILYKPPRAGDVKHSCGDAALAEKTLGFKAKLCLQEGLASWLTKPT